MNEGLLQLTAEEGRIIGAMVEKAMTTPANYPMSLNAIVVACNQVSNRNPIVDYEEPFVELTLRALADRGLAKMVHRPGDRVVKYRHALDEALADDEKVPFGGKPLALLGVLLLRGAQTPGELRQRTTRYVEFDSLPELEVTLEGMRSVGMVQRLERRPGQKEARYVELLSPRLGGDVEDAPPESVPAGGTEADVAQPGELELLRSEVAELTRRLDALLAQLGVDDI